ncbi:hypothetical protein [Leptothrix discophora]|uniref:Uncharacterized protein n=1 Tax=Leptothrix discophora TaxID=89 RepID=A0ABT9G943_LEPDI|nr:hypothetical protein [Leptothrix discophora]MDP4302992.1 hypothetical protein [Leptothrix discophora]
MRLDEIQPSNAAEQRVKRMKANAKVARDRAKQLKAQADVSAERLDMQKSRQKLRQLQRGGGHNVDPTLLVTPMSVERG